MNEIVELENAISSDGKRVLHLMSNNEFAADVLKKYDAPVNTAFEVEKQAGVYQLTTSWPIRGAVKVDAEGWPVPKIFVIWHLDGYASVTAALQDAVKKYLDIYDERPEYAFMKKLPRGIENGVEVEDLTLYDAEWMVNKCVAVGWPR